MSPGGWGDPGGSPLSPSLPSLVGMGSPTGHGVRGSEGIGGGGAKPPEP
jgi:hypothetical protein